MRILVLSTLLAGMPSNAALPASYMIGVPSSCVVPADLAFDPSVMASANTDEVEPADLEAPVLANLDGFLIALEIELGEPAPEGSRLHIGDAAIEAASGAVSVNGRELGPLPDCPSLK